MGMIKKKKKIAVQEEPEEEEYEEEVEEEEDGEQTDPEQTDPESQEPETPKPGKRKAGPPTRSEIEDMIEGHLIRTQELLKVLRGTS